jgi:hypothetical protein
LAGCLEGLWWCGHRLRARWPRRCVSVVLVGLEAGDADCFEAGEEFADAAVVVDPALGFVGLLFGEVSAGGFVGDFAGPVPVGAVQAWRVVVAGAGGLAAAGVALGDRAGQDVG